MTLSPLLVLVLLILVPARFTGAQQESKIKTLAQGLTVLVPEGVTMVRQKPAEDFDLMVFKKGTNAILRVYLGNQAEFPREKRAGPIKKESINGLQTESVTEKQPDGTVSREVLFRLRENGVWPKRMHGWYARLSAKESAEADEILSSVQLADKRAGGK